MQTLIEKLEVLLEAAKTNQLIQEETYHGWFDHSVSSLLPAYVLRLKPIHKLRPWRLEEVPLEGWFMGVDDNPYRVSSVDPFNCHLLINGVWVTTTELFNSFKWTLTPFDANSWKPCGVEE